MGTFLAWLLLASVVCTAIPRKPVRNLGLFLLVVNVVLYTVVYILHLTIV
jgi:hypothetical protein